MLQSRADNRYMRMALRQALLAVAVGEVPVGAVAVKDGVVLAEAFNTTICDRDPTAHAEMTVLRASARKLGSWRLHGVTVYCTLEPCPMCAGAMLEARISRLVFAAADSRVGAVESLYGLLSDWRMPHRVNVTGGVMPGRAAAILRWFFARLRDGKTL